MDERREHFEYDEDGYVIGFKGAESKYTDVCISAHDWRVVEESLPVALEVANRILDDYRHMHPEDRAATFLTVLETIRYLGDRLPEREGAKGEADLPDATGCPWCDDPDPLPAWCPGGHKPTEPVEPGDLRAGDRVGFTYRGERITGNLVSTERGALRSDTPNPNGYHPTVVWPDSDWAFGISEVRLIERASSNVEVIK